MMNDDEHFYVSGTKSRKKCPVRFDVLVVHSFGSLWYRKNKQEELT